MNLHAITANPFVFLVQIYLVQYNSDYPDVMGNMKYVRINGNPDNKTEFNIENMIWETHFVRITGISR